jgi:hypothetical protein
MAQTGSARERDESDPGPGFRGSMGGGVRLGGGGRGGGLAALLGGGGANDPPADPIARVAGGLGGWALGGRALELPTGLAFPLPKGSDLILSTHFHPSGTAQMETSTVGLYFASGPPTQAFTTIQLPPLFSVFEGLDIPAGQERYTLQDSFVIPIDVKAFSVGAHAHYLGKEMKLTATLPDGTAKTLLWIKDWDFSWQERYRFKDFVSLPKGTRLDAVVSYDNSAANKRNPSRPPVRVTWGEESNDEMGSIGLQVVAATRGDNVSVVGCVIKGDGGYVLANLEDSRASSPAGSGHRAEAPSSSPFRRSRKCRSGTACHGAGSCRRRG